MSLVRVLAVQLLVIPSVVYGQVVLGPNEIVATDKRLGLGKGYNTLTGEAKDFKCVDVKPTREEYDENRREQRVTAERGSTFEERSRTETSRARASFGYGGFSASATHQAMQSATTSNYAEYLKIEGRVRFYRDIALANNVKLLVKNDARFYERCGDAFIIGVVVGHDFSADYQSTATTSEEASSIATAFEAAYKGFGGGGDVSVSNEVREAFKKASTRIKFDVSSTKAESLPKFDPVSLIEYARTFGGTASRKDAHPVLFIYASYDSILPEDPAELDSEATYLRALYQRRSDLKYILQYPDSFGPYTVKNVQAELKLIEREIQRRRTIVTQCLDAQVQNTKAALSADARPKRVQLLAKASSGAGECKQLAELAQSRYELRPAVGRVREVGITEAMVQTSELWPIYRPRLEDYPVVAQMRGVYHLTGAGTPSNQPLPTNWVINPNSGCRENPPGNTSCLGTRFVIQEFGTGNGGTYIDRRAFSIPPNSTLNFQVFDTGYPDNTISRDPSNAARVALWQPVYPEDAPPALSAEDVVPDSPPPPKPAPAPRRPVDPCSQRWHTGCSGHFSFPPRDAILRLASGDESVTTIGAMGTRLAPFVPYRGVPALPPLDGATINLPALMTR